MKRFLEKMKNILLLLGCLVLTYAAKAQTPNWFVDASSFEHSMTITGIVMLNDVQVTNTQVILAAFENGQVRGVSNPILVESISDHLFFLTVFSNTSSGAEITFSLYDPDQDKVIDLLDPVSFQSDKVLGTVSSPSILTGTVNNTHTLNLDNVENKTVDELQEIVFTATAVHSDPETTFSFSIDDTSSDKGMEMDGETGDFTWTPEEDQDGEHTVTFTVTDGILTDEIVVVITVNEVNQAPQIKDIDDQEVIVSEQLLFTITASDPDLPKQTLSFSLDASSIEAGVLINQLTGTLSWTPNNNDVGIHEVTVTVNDSFGVSASQLFLITVVSTPITGIDDNQADALTVYPNPTQNAISFSKPVQGSLSLIDGHGRVVYQLDGTQPIDMVDLSALPGGHYIMHFLNLDGEERFFRLIRK
ncbi:MAG: putative Ig domain-containing protein [Reichenbachiella sp.]|uniref:putative Ig domain-containing protein n=1 Tax=Reichenbachiella sp. TaxID=2184521 RepID=UPI003265920A